MVARSLGAKWPSGKRDEQTLQFFHLDRAFLGAASRMWCSMERSSLRQRLWWMNTRQGEFAALVKATAGALTAGQVLARLAGDSLLADDAISSEEWVVLLASLHPRRDHRISMTRVPPGVSHTGASSSLSITRSAGDSRASAA